ncbi:STAS domain-containing protein [Anaerovibrio sp. RM50]|uniref:STAS domain-containing protein n=1 Tax=Anaerovibrio sp. RM50 TaxID=1200557 RepID=UPI00068700E7|nr:STAS domain-containing protein [Anaerovibrio sp. RM50]
MEGITCSITEKKGWTVLSLVGRLDRVNAEDVGKMADEKLTGVGKMAVDLSGLEYISSAGIRVLLRLAKKAKAEGKDFSICGAAGFVQEVLEDSNMDMLVTMVDSVEQLS